MSARRLVLEADGGSRGNPGPAGWGAVVRDAATGDVLLEIGGYLGVATNNVAEYTALVEGLGAIAALDPVAIVEVRMDSRLVVEQMSGRWQVKHADMRRLVDRARSALAPDQVSYVWVPRAQNAAADALANEAMDERRSVRREPAVGPSGAGSAEDGDALDESAVPATAGPVATSGGRARAPRPSGAAMRFDDVRPVTVVLVRHGETELTTSRALSGSSVPGPPLAAAGRVQAARAADLCHRVGRELWPDLPYPSAVVASPMVRTQETGATIGRRVGQPVTTDPDFAEVDFGDWEGLTPAQVEERSPGLLQRWYAEPDLAAPGGESLVDVGRRVGSGLSRLLEGGVDRTVAVASHAMAVRAAVGVTLGLPPTAWAWVRVLPGSVTVLRWWPDGMREAVVVGMPTER